MSEKKNDCVCFLYGVFVCLCKCGWELGSVDEWTRSLVSRCTGTKKRIVIAWVAHRDVLQQKHQAFN
jgi:hypothetical protein